MSELSQLQKVNCGETRVVIPENLGWLEYRLKEEEMNYIKQCIDNRKGDHRKILAGNIRDSNTLHDKDNCPISEDQLKISKGIEVGHIFYFGTKYSEKLGAYVQDSKGNNIPVHMGSYGIGISRLVGAVIEAFHDDVGIKWPLNLAPFKVSIINLMVDNKNCNKVSEEIYQNLNILSNDILYDDRECSIGKKLSDNDLIGTPYQIIIGKRDLENNLIEIKNRFKNKSQKISVSEVKNFISEKIIES